MRVRSRPFAAVLALAVTAACPGPNPGRLVGPFAIGSRSGGSGAGGLLNFSTSQPLGGTAGRPLSPAVRVQVEDTLGSVLTAFAQNVTVKLGANAVGATLSGTTTVRAAEGVATFDSLVIDLAGVYTLVATASGVRTGTSDPFNVFNP